MNKEDYKIAYENVMIANKMLEQENKQLKKENKELNKVCELYGQSLYNADLTKMKSILTDLEEWLKERQDYAYEYENVLDKIQELKEEYK